MKTDTFDIRVDPLQFVEWQDGSGFQPVELYNLGPFHFDRARYEEQLSNPERFGIRNHG